MVSFYGDYNLTETVNIPFNTFSSDNPSESVTVTNLANGDVYVHHDGVEGTPTGITVSLNVGTVDGNHLAIIDLTDTNDAGFYAVGSRYQVRMEGVTIDGATVNAWIGAFSIGCQNSLFADGIVWIDDGGSSATVWPYGTATNPTDTIARGKVIADANALRRIHLHGNFSLAAAMEHYTFLGDDHVDVSDLLDINSQSVEHSTFHRMLLTGTGANATGVANVASYIACGLYAHTNIHAICRRGEVDGACSILDGGIATFEGMTFGSLAACTLTLQAPAACNISAMDGTLTLAGMDGGVCSIELNPGATLTIDNTCTAGAISVTGSGSLTDNSAAGCTVTDGRSIAQSGDVYTDSQAILTDLTDGTVILHSDYDAAKTAAPTAAAIADAVWDEAYAGHTDVGSFGILIGSAFEEV